MKTYGIPLLLWASTVAGLVLALVGDGLADVVAVVLVALPIAVSATAAARGAPTP